jgi:hypothetical protein
VILTCSVLPGTQYRFAEDAIVAMTRVDYNVLPRLVDAAKIGQEPDSAGSCLPALLSRRPAQLTRLFMLMGCDYRQRATQTVIATVAEVDRDGATSTRTLAQTGGGTWIDIPEG